MKTFDPSILDKIPDGEPIRSAWEAFAEDLFEAKSSIVVAGVKWDALSGSLTLPPESSALYEALQKPVSEMTYLADSTRTLGAPMFDAADRLTALKSRAEITRTRIDDYHGKVARGMSRSGNIPSDEADALVAEQDLIEQELASITTEFEAIKTTVKDGLASAGFHRFPTVTSNFEQSGDWAFLGADDLAESLLDGSSSDPVGDFEKLKVLLGQMSPEEIAALYGEIPTVNMLTPSLGADPTANIEWWESLDDRQQEALTEYLPGIVGNLEGLSYADRRPANEHNLELMHLRAVEQQTGVRDWGLTGTQMTSYAQLSETLAQAQQEHAVEGPVADPNNPLPANAGLYAFDPVGVDGQPLMALAIGDPDTATHQSYYVPGMGSSLSDDPTSLYMDGNAVYSAQQQYLAQGESNAVIGWLGYDTPNAPQDWDHFGSTEVLSSPHANDGGQRLAESMNGLHAANEHRGEPAPYISIVAHSYGTTTAAVALTQTNFTVDSATFFGSAGIDEDVATSAADFNLETDPNTGRPALYATTAIEDSVARIPMSKDTALLHGDPRLSPTDKPFGANVFEVGGENGRHGVGDHLTRNDMGTGYLDDGTVSQDAIGAFSVGRGDHIMLWDEGIRDDVFGDAIVFGDGQPEVIYEP